jgi:hypothetical protein
MNFRNSAARIGRRRSAPFSSGCWKLVAVVAGILACQGESSLLQAADGTHAGAEKILVPGSGWTCGMPGGIPVPEQGTLVFEANLQVDQVYDVGRTPYGLRKVIVIQGGTIAGEKINGTVMRGGLDFQLDFSNGTLEIEQVFVLKTVDGKYIYLRSAGVGMNQRDVRMVPKFEAPEASNHQWLNEGNFVGRRVIDLPNKTMKLSVYDVSGVSVQTGPSNSLQVTKPADVVDQPWEYRRAENGEKRGDVLITENVTLGGSQSVGATKGGGRNIIPITGGTVNGRIVGKVLPGGADYQKIANPVTLDARYLWQTEEGDVIIVRNGGPISKLAPTFEVRLDSKYAWLNKGNYLSSGPSVGAGGVALTFYERTP